GSKFSVLLPGAGGVATSPADGEKSRQPAQAEGCAVLIIDDEEMVRRAARAALEHYGYTVFEATDGRDGIELFSRLHDRVAAVLLDLTMPRMDGQEVWLNIREMRPDMAVVVSSGYDEMEARRQFSEVPDLHFLKKPYTANALVKILRAAMKG